MENRKSFFDTEIDIDARRIGIFDFENQEDITLIRYIENRINVAAKKVLEEISTKEPFIGAVVNYISRGSADGAFKPELRAAIVTSIGDQPGEVGLAVINPTGIFFSEAVEYSNEGKPGSWTWAGE